MNTIKVLFNTNIIVFALTTAENVNVANIRSITRVLDAWGKRIFKDIKTLLHSQPSDLLPDYSRYKTEFHKCIISLRNYRTKQTHTDLCLMIIQYSSHVWTPKPFSVSKALLYKVLSIWKLLSLSFCFCIVLYKNVGKYAMPFGSFVILKCAVRQSCVYTTSKELERVSSGTRYWKTPWHVK